MTIRSKLSRGAMAIAAALWVAAGVSAGEFTVPATEPGENGWETYVDPPTLDASNAGAVAPGTASPEAAVTHFYASRIRGDRAWEEVLVARRSGRLERKLAKLEEWTFRRFRLVGRKERGEGSLWIKVWFEIEVGGETDSGSDEVGVRRVDGEWRIESVPS